MRLILVLSCILCSIVFLLFSSIRVSIEYKFNALNLRFGYMFLNLDLNKLINVVEKKIPAIETEDNPEESKKDSTEKDKKTKKLKFDLELLPDILKVSAKSIKFICRNFIIYRFEIGANISADDAHQTALMYGKISSAIVALVSVLDKVFVLHKPKINLSPNFASTKSEWDIFIKIKVQPIILIIASISFIKNYIKIQKRPSTQSNRKGGKFNEPRTSN